MADLTLKEIQVIELTQNDALPVKLSKETIWKIESAGIGGTGGGIYLINAKSQKLAILFNSVNQSSYSSNLPFWLTNFEGGIINESADLGCISISIYSIA